MTGAKSRRALDEQIGLILREGEQPGAETLLPGAR